MEKIIIANHKMNLNISEINEYINKLKTVKDKFIVCPTSIYIPYFVNSGYRVGIQNVHFKDYGAYTGEVSPYQAKKIGANYAIIGHSERRINFNETDEIIKEKIDKCLKNKLTVILCVGETLEERENGKTFEVIKKQLSILDNPENVIVSYEPVWMIGNDKILDINDIKEVVKFIKKCYNVKVLYGGGISEDNIALLNQVKNLDGYIIGSASTNASELLKILEVTEK